MYIQIVNFSLNGITPEQYEHACEEKYAPLFASMPGLISKVWLSDPASNTFGGVYTWADRESMEAYKRSPVFQSLLANPFMTYLTSRDFEVLEAPSRVTNGLVAAASAR
jgi:hypothetical protein